MKNLSDLNKYLQKAWLSLSKAGKSEFNQSFEKEFKRRLENFNKAVAEFGCEAEQLATGIESHRLYDLGAALGPKIDFESCLPPIQETRKPLIYTTWYPKSNRYYYRVSPMPRPFNPKDKDRWEKAREYVNRMNNQIVNKQISEF